MDTKPSQTRRISSLTESGSYRAPGIIRDRAGAVKSTLDMRSKLGYGFMHDYNPSIFKMVNLGVMINMRIVRHFSSLGNPAYSVTG
jgi:hypothetical protein